MRRIETTREIADKLGAFAAHAVPPSMRYVLVVYEEATAGTAISIQTSDNVAAEDASPILGRAIYMLGRE